MLSNQFNFSFTPFLLFFLAFSATVVVSDILADREALLRLRTAIQGRTIGWNITSLTPCSWEGVTCNTTTNRVIELRLPGDGLSGTIPLNSIGDLTELRTLSIRHNSLTGSIPDDISSCVELRNLYLHENNFSSELPPGFFQLTNLVHVNLAGNNFSGELSPGFRNFTRLRTLFLENNQFSGSILELNSLGGLRELNVSFNRLNGSIPSNLVTFSSQSFLGNSLCGEPLQSCSDGGNKLSGGEIAGIVVGSVIGLILVLSILFFLCTYKPRISRKTNQQDQRQISPLPPSTLKIPEYKFQRPEPIKVTRDHDLYNSSLSSEGGNEITRRMMNHGASKGLVFFYTDDRSFTLEALLRASAEVLGKGSTGTTYRAYVDGENEVVVKRLKNVSISERLFREKVEELAKLDHENLIPLKAYYYGRDEKLLVYESMAGASLEAILHGNSSAERASLTWTIRRKIVSRIASGIEYLHSHGPGFSHGNIKSSNILLTNYYDVRITGYGLLQLMHSSYFSQKDDVYSFGVLLLELLSGKSPSKDDSDLPKWVRSVATERWKVEVFDPELLRHEYSEEEMVRLVHLSIDCTSRDPDRRPSMSEVVRHIEGNF